MPNYSDEALDIRMRLLRLHELNRIVYPKKVWKKIEKCLIEKTDAHQVGQRLERILPETMTTEFATEMEFALVDAHGMDRYRENGRRLHEDIERASVLFRIYTLRDEIYAACGHTLKTYRQERMDDAAWFAVTKNER